MKRGLFFKSYLILVPLMSCGNFSQTIEKDIVSDSESIEVIKQDEIPKIKFDIFETLNGWLRRGVEQKTIIDSLGIPDNKGDDEYWGSTGTYVQEWKYKALGLILYMESDEFEGNKTVFIIEVVSPSSYKTSKGVGIGATMDFVLKKHANEINEEASDQDVIIIGSIYEGTYFFIKEGKVNNFIIGALAD